MNPRNEVSSHWRRNNREPSSKYPHLCQIKWRNKKLREVLSHPIIFSPRFLYMGRCSRSILPPTFYYYYYFFLIEADGPFLSPYNATPGALRFFLFRYTE
jgi:hypothetical protein